MAVKRTNPMDIDVISALPDVGQLENDIAALIQRVRDVDTDMLGWLKRQADLVRLRMGIRDRKKSVPWKNSSNIAIPLTDGIIRRWRPGITSLVLDADPVAFFSAQEPNDFETARRAEPYFHFMFTEEMDTTYQTIQLVDTIAWHGHAYTRQSWDYRTSRSARVASSESLFPGGIQQFVEQAIQQELANLQPGQPQPSPQDIVMEVLETQYDLDRNLPDEGPMLLAAAKALLQGAPYVRIVYRTVTRDVPGWDVINPVFVIVPQDQNPEDAEFFCIVHMITEDKLRAMAIDKYLPADRVGALLAQGNKSATPNASSTADSARDRIQDLMDRRAGRSQRHSERDTGFYTLWEIYCRLDIDRDGERERAVLWYAPEHDLSVALQDYVFPFPDAWPITYYPFEAARRPIDNRGIADMVKTLQKLVNAYHNMRIDAGQIMLAPVLTARMTGGNFKRTIKYHPGAIIPVQTPNDITPLVHDMRILGQLLQEEQTNQRIAETYVGVFDATLTNISESRERRTAAEVNAIQGLSSNIFGLDAKIFQVAFSRSLNQLWNLWLEFGPAETFQRVTGEAPIEIRKADIGKNFDIRAAGTPANTNRSFQIATIERALQLLLNPVILQSGEFDFIKLVKRLLTLLDRNLAQGIIRSAEDATAVQTIRQAAGVIDQQRGIGDGGPAAFF